MGNEQIYNFEAGLLSSTVEFSLSQHEKMVCLQRGSKIISGSVG